VAIVANNAKIVGAFLGRNEQWSRGVGEVGQL
jgi:hypothetical protein